MSYYDGNDNRNNGSIIGDIIGGALCLIGIGGIIGSVAKNITPKPAIPYNPNDDYNCEDYNSTDDDSDNCDVQYSKARVMDFSMRNNQIFINLCVYEPRKKHISINITHALNFDLSPKEYFFRLNRNNNGKKIELYLDENGRWQISDWDELDLE